MTNDEVTAFYRPYKNFESLFSLYNHALYFVFGHSAMRNEKNLQHCLILGYVPYPKRALTGRLMAVGNYLFAVDQAHISRTY